jgi:Ni,Fe-hydrogenase I small subunit
MTMSEPKNIHVIWLPGQACTVLDLLTGFIPQAAGVTLDYHATIMAPWGEEALKVVDAAERGELGPFVLVLEGAIPDETLAKASGGYWCVIGEDEEGNPVTFSERLDRLAKNAAAIVSAGTCASFGGIPAGKPNPTGAMGAMEYLGKNWKSALGIPIINVPGCPSHGEHLAEVLAYAVLTDPCSCSALRPMIIVPERGLWAMVRIVTSSGSLTAWASWAARAPLVTATSPGGVTSKGWAGVLRWVLPVSAALSRRSRMLR